MPDQNERPWTTCKTCNRVLYVDDADKDGNCPDHLRASVPAERQAPVAPAPKDD